MTFSVGEFHLITYAERADSAEMSIVVMCADNHVALIDTAAVQAGRDLN